MADESAHSTPRHFAHLHQHTDYSLLDGAARIRDLVAWVKEVSPEKPALAMTDHGNMHGTVQFYKAALAQGVKPILGLEAYLTSGSRFDRKRPESKIDGGYFHLTLLAKDLEGYRNLCRLSTRSWLEGYYYKPRIDMELLREHNEGIIALSGCLGAQLPRAILDQGEDAGEQILRQYLEIFGEERFFIELQDHGLPDQKLLNPVLKSMAQRHGLGMAATNDGHYVRKEDAEAHEALLAIQTKATLSDPDRFRFPCNEFYVKTPDEMAEVLPEDEYPGALANTMTIADMCNVELPLGSKRVYQMPEFPVQEGRTLAEQLRIQTYAGLSQRYGTVDEAMWRAYLASAERAAGDAVSPDDLSLVQVHERLARYGERGRQPLREGAIYPAYEYPHLDTFAGEWHDAGALERLKRAEYELGVIIAMGFPDYFLIVADFINWAKEQGIAVGPGRGSGVGSIVAYSLRITDLDPLQFNLLFERFLTTERVSMPDFDIDFSDARRGEVIDYVRRKYGDDRVAHIATFGTMAAKAAIRDAARVMEAPYADADKLSKLIPVIFGKSKSIDATLAEVPEFRELYEAGARPFVDVARQLEGLTRHASVHAAGIIIARDPVQDLAPLFRSGDGPVICQYDMGSVEDLGFLKMDFLGLRTLSFIEAAVRIVRDSRGIELDPDSFPIDDRETFELLSRGDSAGVFQFESSGMVETLRRIKPHAFEHLIAINALYRPGPMDNLPTYIRRFLGQEEVSYTDFPKAEPVLEPILRETFGIPVYQEQTMQIVQAVAGYSLGQADILRRIMGKKKVEEMTAQRALFREGAKANGIEQAEADRIFDLLEKFANYGFNKSHSAAYVVLAFQTAYLKAHYPVEFVAALLTVERANTDKVVEYIGDARHMGIDVLPPDINISGADFTAVGEVVRFGLYGIRNVGQNAVDAIIRERDSGGPFRDLFDFTRRVDSSLVNRRALEYLIKAGAFDSLGDRNTLLANAELAVRWGAEQQEMASSGQMGLFGDMEIAPPEPKAGTRLTELELLRMEKDALGLYISSHPMASYPGLAQAASTTVARLEEWLAARPADTGPGSRRQRVVLAGLMQRVVRRQTRKGTMMARFELGDESGSREVVAFSRVYDEISGLLAEDRPAVLIAEVSAEEGDLRLVADRLIPWDEQEGLPRIAVFEFDAADVGEEQLLELRAGLDVRAGRTPVRFRLHGAEATVDYSPDGFRIDEQQLDELADACPWLSCSVTLDRDQLLAQRAANGFGREARKPVASVDVPF